MVVPSEKTLYDCKRGPYPQVVDEDKFRFDMFIILIEEWLRKKLRVRLVVDCLR